MQIIKAARSPTKVHSLRGSSKNAVTYTGVLYERKAAAMLRRIFSPDVVFERNPWFTYIDADARYHACAPDILIHDPRTDFVIVIEIKNTWTPLAQIKLRDIYCPVVKLATGLEPRPLVLVKNLTPDAPPAQSCLTLALTRDCGLIQWLGRGNIRL